MNSERYLGRIGFSGSLEPTADTLRQLHRAHMLTVPFENLDISLGNRIELDLPLLYEKIVTRRRGGFCYELNGLFAWLLCELGYDVVLLSARVFSSGSFNAEFDHLLLLVDTGEQLIADIGFGDSFIEPLGFTQIGRDTSGRSYRFIEADSNWILQQQQPLAAWQTQYKFTLRPRQLADFRPMCHYHQTSPHSGFTRKSICSLTLPDGRVSLSANQLIVTKTGQRHEQTIPDTTAYRVVLQQHFGVELDDEIDLTVLLYPKTAT
ncbi:MAG: arylamine N-acetyltransferase [Anaerolineae bacterium]|nr:arylamine N-acetyltransferase [Anaerolineae bacterium]